MKSLTAVTLSALLLLPSLLPPARAADAIALPDIGDSSATVLTPAQEQSIGQEMMRSLRQSGKLLTDPEAEHYIQSLGYRLLSTSGSNANEYHFFVVSDPTINAFAMPGGYIGIHTGLILASRSESELAGVVAHEIAHVSQRHLARSFEKASSMNLPLTAAVIAAILLGASNPQMGEAALAAAMAGGTQMQLDFTRANEREADRVGIQMLAHADFDPHGMPGFFERLQQEYRFSNTALPEFLSTHPVTTDRIADSRNRAEQYPINHPNNGATYRLLKAKLRVMAATNLHALEEQLRDTLTQGNSTDEAADRYAYALTLMRTRQYDQARRELATLLKRDPGRISYLLAQAETEAAAQDHAQAASIYNKGLALYPNNPLLVMGLADNRLRAGDLTAATRLLRDFTRVRRAPPRAYELLAQAESRNGNTGIAHIALADYYYALGELPTAVEQLNLARRSKDLDFYHQSLLEAKLGEFQERLKRDGRQRGRGE